MQTLLLDIKGAVAEAGGALPPDEDGRWRERYRALLAQAEKECPAPDHPKPGTRGRPKRSKARNLLERLAEFENEMNYCDLSQKQPAWPTSALMILILILQR